MPPSKPYFVAAALAGKPKLIGLTGKARSGKDTVATLLQKHYMLQNISFAGPIRAALRAMIGLDDRHFHGDLKEVSLGWVDKSPRQLMQTLGTEWARGCVDQDFWIKVAKKNIDYYRGIGTNVIVTDVRFENEADFIRREGGELWHVIRPGVESVAAHASEAGVRQDTLDYIILNDQGLQELEDQVCTLYERSFNVH